MRLCWLLCSLSMGLPACRRSESSQLKAIIGNDGLRPIGEADGQDLPLAAVGRLQGGCTAFHLGQGLVATAGHCLPPPTGALEDMPCTAATIEWHGSLQSSHCLRYLAHRHDAGADYALMEVNPAPEAALTLASPTLIPSPSAFIVGFPQERELSRSERCHIRSQGPELFAHDCDTLPGNSGSPVFDAESRRVIGIHNGEANQENYGTWLEALGELSSWQEIVAKTPDVPEELAYGPFTDGEHRLLSTLSRRLGEHVRFKLELDLEEGFDQLVLTDGRGVQKIFTGQKIVELDLLTPVSVILKTDYSGSSQSVQLHSIATY